MSKVKSQLSRVRPGFTLIELLIVIVILGILAVALLSAINPMEQIKKANDSGKKSDSAELLNAVERYYTTFGCYPWENTDKDCGAETVNLSAQPPVSATGLPETWLDGTGGYSLVEMNEVKPEFATRDNLEAAGTGEPDNVLITETTTGLIYVCFEPESKTFGAQANKDSIGGDGTTHICVPE